MSDTGQVDSDDVLPIFAYGTLLELDTLAELGAAPTAREPAAALGRHIAGERGYPAVSFEGDGVEEIRGELLSFDETDFPHVLRRLDAYEDAPRLFRRLRVYVRTQDEQLVAAHTYSWARG